MNDGSDDATSNDPFLSHKRRANIGSSSNRMLLATVCLLLCAPAWSQSGNVPGDVWRFMRGKWVGEGSSELGQGSGYFSFEPDLLGKSVDTPQSFRFGDRDQPALQVTLQPASQKILARGVWPKPLLTRLIRILATTTDLGRPSTEGDAVTVEDGR
jgi:hypothetical protein